jgi:aminomethyltransferase
VNAACKADDLTHLQRHLDEVQLHDDRALLALQGPKAASVLTRLAPQVGEMLFMQGANVTLLGVECFVTRSGYTGEDGFEISVPAGAGLRLARELLSYDEVEPIGLGARDTLRLEAGLCLYGHDIDSHTTPVEAELRWALSKARRPGGDRAGGYPGVAVVERQLREGAPRKRVGLAPRGRAPVREGIELIDTEGESAGVVTSGGFGPTVNHPIAMGYVDRRCSEPGALLTARVRGKEMEIEVHALPFVKQNYHRGRP